MPARWPTREGALALATAAAPAPRLRALAEGVDWGATRAVLERELALGSAWRRLGWAGVVPFGEEGLRWRRAAMVSEFRRRQAVARLEAAVAALDDAGIPVLLLKGAAAVAVEGPDCLRPMADLDLLVRPEELDAAVSALAGAGWRPSGEPARPGHHHLPALRDSVGGVPIELHRALYVDGHPFALDGAALWRTAHRAEVAGRPVLVAAPEERLVHLATHWAWSHLFRHGSWRMVRDVAALRTGGLDPERVIELARATRATSAVWWALRVHARAAGVAMDPLLDRALRPAGVARLGAGVLERHVLAQVVGGAARCPSVRVERALWAAAIRPRGSGHGPGRPWDHDSAPVPRRVREGGAGGRATRPVMVLARWAWRLLVRVPGVDKVSTPGTFTRL